jgi:hypothetical protein
MGTSKIYIDSICRTTIEMKLLPDGTDLTGNPRGAETLYTVADDLVPSPNGHWVTIQTIHAPIQFTGVLVFDNQQ